MRRNPDNAPDWAPAREPLAPLTLNAVGDLYFGRRIRHEPGIESLATVMRDAEVTFGNAEMLFHDFDSAPQPEMGGTWSASPREYAEELPFLGINLAALPNNHAGDYGVGGFAQQIEAMEAQGIVHAGTGMDLAQARRPAFLDTPAGRVALIAACSTYHESARAGHVRRDALGRPGLNPLRHHTRYRVDAEGMDALRRVSQELNISPEHRIWGFHRIWDFPDDAAKLAFLRDDFVEGDDFAIESRTHEVDLREHEAMVRWARRQADYVIVSLHSHEFDTAKHEPAGFMVEFAHACIDAGADAFFGHGPHLLRGVELYKERPILYSLGNFLMHINMFMTLPEDLYEAFDMPPGSTPADIYDRRATGETTGFFADRRYWESAIARLEFPEPGAPPAVRLQPVELGRALTRPQRGTPRLADPELGRHIVEDVARMSEPFNTTVEWDGQAGIVGARAGVRA